MPNINLSVVCFKEPLGGQSGEDIQGIVNAGEKVSMAEEVGHGQPLGFFEGGGKISDKSITYKVGPISLQNPEVVSNEPHNEGSELSMNMDIIPLKTLVQGGK
ncbi:unnamed protein product [Prunus armeniaca]|nr:unnamed protein product [Prunus armeniaca]